MRNKFLLLLFIAFSAYTYSQVGINTSSPETTFEVVGKGDDLSHYDGILPPRISGNQLSKKTYTSSKKGTVIFVTNPPTVLAGQVINILEAGLYYFDGNNWQSLSKDTDPIEYYISLRLDSESTSALAAESKWSEPRDQWGNINNYKTSTKYYTVGTKNYGDLKGFITFRKIQGIVNVRFQIYRPYGAGSVSENVFINIGDIFSDIGYIPNQIVLLHNENSTQYFPALLENFSLQIPFSSMNLISASSYTYGEVQGYSNWRKPYLK
ncbi:hypothetical protein BBI01_18225 [Chryseobacterium artocarpi]|uniref:Uncharacterized protein n=1 Tax=Chryseobacterium artocarpi TaxID=1414727 RepID=A0A1B8ZBZ5_9FLAO|nr:hypothetical protein [Chryseobacterium artocarpi]OCA69141.1 hypothetical protein BBI01_18225 [Chryseobacterium artocarpi]